MTEKECAQILAIVRAVYPHVPIKDPKGMVAGWMLELSEYDSQTVLNAARLHISTNKYFPNPANIKENIVKAQLVYQPVTELKQIKASMTDTDEVEKKIRAVWEDLGGCW